jgi:hypothetical protein
MSSCGCINCYVDEESGLYEEEQNKWCVEHNEVVCVECERIIDPFVPHIKEVCISYEDLDNDIKPYEDAERTTYRTCHTCYQLRNEFFCNGWFYGISTIIYMT